jgi:hypothetical protein
VADFPSVNEQALHLVARELAVTLNEVRIALEAAAETPAEKAPIARVAELMRDARGVLRVVEVYGAALLAEEMEQTSRWLAGNETDARRCRDGRCARQVRGLRPAGLARRTPNCKPADGVRYGGSLPRIVRSARPAPKPGQHRRLTKRIRKSMSC